MSKLLVSSLTAIIFGLPLTSIADEVNPIVGKWKSNESMTVRYLHNESGLSDEQKEFFSNGFFGKLVHIFQKDSFISFSTDDVPEEPTYIEYTIKGADSESYIISYQDPDLKTMVKETLHLDGDCFYVEPGKSKIREYFCRVD